MQLKVARLCADCEEVHDAPRCPACASETFVYLTRWVPAVKREPPPARRRILAPTMTERIVFGSSLLGLLAFGVGRWVRRARTRLEETAVRDAGELR